MALRFTVLDQAGNSNAMSVSRSTSHHCTMVWRGTCASRATLE